MFHVKHLSQWLNTIEQMFHVKLGRPISQTSGKEGGGTATSRASRRCSSCASESSRSEFLESVAPARNSEGPAFAEPPVETRGRFASSHRAGARNRDARDRALATRVVSSAPLASIARLAASRESSRRLSMPRPPHSSLSNSCERQESASQPASPPERQKSNVGRREKRQKGDAAGNLPRSSLAGGMGRKKWGATKRGSGTASKKQVRFPRCHSTRAATFFATPKRLRASSSGNPSTYMTSASPTPVATTPNRYMGRYSPSSAIVVNGMV